MKDKTELTRLLLKTLEDQGMNRWDLILIMKTLEASDYASRSVRELVEKLESFVVTYRQQWEDRPAIMDGSKFYQEKVARQTRRQNELIQLSKELLEEPLLRKQEGPK